MRDRRSLPGRASQWDAMREYQLDFLLRQGLDPFHKFLDIGCGPLRGGAPIINYLQPGHYTGVEKWGDSLAEAFKEVKSMGLEGREPALVGGDVTHRDFGFYGKVFDRILAFSVLHHLFDAEVAGLARFVRRHLAKDGVFYCTALTGEYKILPDWFHYPLICRPLEYYRTAFDRNGLTAKFVEEVPVLHSEHMMGVTLKE